MKLDKSKIYDLSELTDEEKEEVGRNIFKPTNIKNVFNYNYIEYREDSRSWLATSAATKTTNAKELFYTLENIQVDCSELTEEQVKEMCKVYEINGYKQWMDPEAFIIIDNFTYLRIDSENEFYITGGLDTKTTITYEKFMELFGNKEENFKKLVEVLNEELTEEYNKETDRERINLEFNPQSEHKLYEAYKETEYEVKYIAEKPNQYQIGIDTFERMEANCTKEECLAFAKGNIDKYNWRNKGQDLEDLEKIISYANWAIKQLKK